MLRFIYPEIIRRWRWYFTSNYIYDRVQKLIKKHHTRDPFKILENIEYSAVAEPPNLLE